MTQLHIGGASSIKTIQLIFEVFTVVKWVVTLYGVVGFQCFRGLCYLHLHHSVMTQETSISIYIYLTPTHESDLSVFQILGDLRFHLWLYYKILGLMLREEALAAFSKIWDKDKLISLECPVIIQLNL
jgi:hypothetical protein